MSDTPRTDEATFQILSSLQSGTENVVYQSFTRQLERELAAVTADLCAFAVDMEKQLSAVTAELARDKPQLRESR